MKFNVTQDLKLKPNKTHYDKKLTLRENVLIRHPWQVMIKESEAYKPGAFVCLNISCEFFKLREFPYFVPNFRFLL